ncbi:uncharacterized protein L3040_005258 [Drepanopeziza brunnea f. sp. 'multigermtubi']|uniref:uncharacterized protein n=1 Tax=Drepanopeziza brunnea f. sp. 'multigermtubi' TaxID=698441 RepID=UPI0023860834|nr:hypothetical protein L3040_005258 [Drepanopeziza brunnea f. sp. 'multigermtubi']
MKVISTLALLSGLAGLALACPDGYFEDCCAEYGPTSPEELRRMTVDESIIPEGVTIAGYARVREDASITTAPLAAASLPGRTGAGLLG